MAALGAKNSGCETTHACCTSSDDSRQPWQTAQAEVVCAETRCLLRDLEPLTDALLGTSLTLGISAKTKWVSARLDMERLRQPDEVVAEQAPAGARTSDESEDLR